MDVATNPLFFNSDIMVEASPVTVQDFMVPASEWRRSEIAVFLLVDVVCKCFSLMTSAITAGWQLLDWKPSNLMLTRSLTEADAKGDLTFQVLLVDWAGTTLAPNLNHYQRAKSAKESLVSCLSRHRT